jgi:hypothetical protein
MRKVREVATEIRREWPNVHFAAEPYLQAMEQLDSPSDNFGYDSGKSVILYFLANAQHFRGESARQLKKELKSMVGVRH